MIRTAWQALTRNPVGFLTSSWPWRSLAYLFSGVGVGLATTATLIALAASGVILALAVIGLVLLFAILLSGLVVARFERWRMLLVDLDRAPDPHRTPDRPGLRGWLATRLHERQTWQELGFVAVSILGLWWLDLGVLVASFLLPGLCVASLFLDHTLPWYGFIIEGLAAPLLVVVAAYPVTAWAGARAALTRAILSPRENELGVRLGEVSRSRARLVDAYEVERRRIERDLHDGAQQRLIALTVKLGLARLDLPTGSPAATELDEAHELARLALVELRELIRGVHPQVLTARGLPAAATDAAGRSPVPVSVDIALDGRLPASVEAAAYFVITESLANVAKHSKASRAAVQARVVDDRLILEIRDDGVGGADPTAGTGLSGLADRAAAANGTLTVSSPAGGPTLIRAELSCVVE